MAEEANKLALIAEMAAAYLRRNSVGQEQIGSVVGSITRALQQAERDLTGEAAAAPAAEAAASAEKPTPAVAVRSSIKPDAITCLECGSRQKTLKRHLSVAHGLTPAQYREKWGLKRDYPMVAPSYSEQRSAMAKKLGLGNKGRGARRRNTAA